MADPTQETQSQRKATFYYKENFQGREVALPPGEYTRAELERYGIENNTISSVKVPAHLKVVLYKHDNFTGDRLTLRSDADELGEMHNNASSIKVISV